MFSERDCGLKIDSESLNLDNKNKKNLRKSRSLSPKSPKKINNESTISKIRFEERMDPHASSSIQIEPKNIPTDRPVRIYCDGIYDLFHYGHARSLEQAKKLFPNVHLIVGVCNDVVTHNNKGMTVFYEEERNESLRHCKWVDEVVENAPWIIDQEFMDLHEIDFVAHDDIPYVSGNYLDVYKFAKDQNKFLATQRTEGISTSGIITRIVHDYDLYVRRNLERGVSAKELNISLFKLGEFRMQKSVRELGGKLQNRLEVEEQNIRRNWESTKDELNEALAAWESRSHEFVKGFVDLFQDKKQNFIKQLYFWRDPTRKAIDGEECEIRRSKSTVASTSASSSPIN